MGVIRKFRQKLDHVVENAYFFLKKYKNLGHFSWLAPCVSL